jgi:hypothetical protein
LSVPNGLPVHVLAVPAVLLPAESSSASKTPLPEAMLLVTELPAELESSQIPSCVELLTWFDWILLLAQTQH